MELPDHDKVAEQHPAATAGAASMQLPAPDVNVSAGFEQFEGKTPLQVARALFPKFTDDWLAGFFIGLGIDLGIPLPDWAKAASQQFWKYFVGPDFDPLNSSQHAGVLFGLAEGIVKTPPLHEPYPLGVWLKNAFTPVLEAGSKEVHQQLNPDEAAKFYAGRAKSAAVIERMKNPDYLKMIKRAPIYLSIAICWKTFESFTSQAGAERWLRSEKVISENVDAREVRAILSLIRLKYRGPGRPKGLKTGCSNSLESGLPPVKNPDSA